jgi:hypothetical protein
MVKGGNAVVVFPPLTFNYLRIALEGFAILIS